MATLSVNINRASHGGAQVILQRLFGFPHREVKRGGDRTIRANRLWLVVPGLDDGRAEAFAGLLLANGAPRNAVEVTP